jgi:hypothetical protein
MNHQFPAVHHTTVSIAQYNEQLQEKARRLKQLLGQFENLPDLEVSSLFGRENLW